MNLDSFSGLRRGVGARKPTPALEQIRLNESGNLVGNENARIGLLPGKSLALDGKPAGSGSDAKLLRRGHGMVRGAIVTLRRLDQKLALAALAEFLELHARDEPSPVRLLLRLGALEQRFHLLVVRRLEELEGNAEAFCHF